MKLKITLKKDISLIKEADRSPIETTRQMTGFDPIAATKIIPAATEKTIDDLGTQEKAKLAFENLEDLANLLIEPTSQMQKLFSNIRKLAKKQSLSRSTKLDEANTVELHQKEEFLKINEEILKILEDNLIILNEDKYTKNIFPQPFLKEGTGRPMDFKFNKFKKTRWVSKIGTGGRRGGTYNDLQNLKEYLMRWFTKIKKFEDIDPAEYMINNKESLFAIQEIYILTYLLQAYEKEKLKGRAEIGQLSPERREIYNIKLFGELIKPNPYTYILNILNEFKKYIISNISIVQDITLFKGKHSSAYDAAKSAAAATEIGTAAVRESLKEQCDITNNSTKDLSQLENIISRFYPYVKEKLKFDQDAKVNLISDPENAKDPWGKTAYYNPEAMEITIFVDNRHPKDMLRSLSHELVHHSQNCRGDFQQMGALEPGYAQKDPHLRRLEGEAYLLGNGFLVRDFEDSLKQNLTENKIMKGLTREQLETVLTKTLTRVMEESKLQEEEDVVEEGEETYNRDEDMVEESVEEAKEEVVTEEEDITEETVEEGPSWEKPDAPDVGGIGGESWTSSRPTRGNYGEMPSRAPKYDSPAESDYERQNRERERIRSKPMRWDENLHPNSKKDELLFERLVKKWTK